MSTLPKGWTAPIPRKGERLQKLTACLLMLPPARSGLEAFAQVTNALNLLEDQLWGPDHYLMPRTYEGGRVTDRLYASHPESFETVDGWIGVMNMVHTKEFIFMSRFGAIEIQRDTGESESEVCFCTRRHAVLFAKVDAAGHGVWHAKNRDDIECGERTCATPICAAVRAVVADRGWVQNSNVAGSISSIAATAVEKSL
jgi:hypothetical protein